MVRFTFKKGLRFLQTSKIFTLLRRLANGNFQLEDQAGEISSLTEAEIHSRWISGQWQIDEESLGPSSNVFYFTTPQDLKSLPPQDQLDVKRRMEYLRKIKEMFENEGLRLVSSRDKLVPKIALVAAELGDSSPPSPNTLWKWWRKFAPTKCITKLVIARRAGRRYDSTQRSVFDEAVAEVFLTPQQLPRKAVVEAVQRKIRRINQSVRESERVREPSQATIYRWLDMLYYQVVANARQGRAATSRELRRAIGRVKVSQILERIELDHTPLDIVVICMVTRLILGRPWLTLAIDRYSRMITGFYISFHAPSSTSVLYCLRMMIMPKEHILARFPDVQGPWPARGLPDTIVTDNGMELHSHAVEAVSLEMGINLHYCGVAHPEMKGAIERMIGTVNRGLIHTLPGTTFSNIEQRGDYDSEGHAAIDIEVLTHLLVKWIADQYHKTPHRGLGGRTPLSVWQNGEKTATIELPAFPRQLETIIGLEATRTLFHYGLEFGNLRYNSPTLQALREPGGGTRELQLRAFEHDVGYIAVFHPTLEEFIDVPAVNQEYSAGVNRYVHQLVCAEVRLRFGDSWTNDQLLNVKGEIQAIVDEAVRGKKAGNRKKGASMALSDSEQIIDGTDTSALKRACQQSDPTPKPRTPIAPGMDDELPEFHQSKRINEGHAA